MGKDKKEKNPADAFRKDQRKKELLKLKKDREMVKGVRDMLNDPRKIDEEIAKAQKISDENKLDKSLKDKIKELQRMKDVANTRQLVLAAQGKKSIEEAESIIKPSIYQKNEGVWDNPGGNKASSSGHGHVKSASRISTEGLAPYIPNGDSNLATQMPLPTSTITPYPAYAPNAFPRGPAGMVPGGVLQQAGRGPVMGGVAGIPLPPPRPVAPAGAIYNPALLQGVPQGLPQGYAIPPPPPRPGMQGPGGFVPPPPGPPPGYPPHMYGYAPVGLSGGVQGMPVPGMYAYPPQHAYLPQQGYGAPPPQHQYMLQQQQPRGPPKSQYQQHQQQPKDRKLRPPRGSAEEIDPLDPAGRGYTERFGAAPSGKKPVAQTQRQEEVVEATVQLPPSLAPVETVGDVESKDDVGSHIVEASHPGDNSTDISSVAPAPAPFVPSYTALSAEELMRRRHMVPTEYETSVRNEPAGPSAGPSFAPSSVSSFSYPTLSAEELLRRRHQLPAEESEAAVTGNADEDFVPARPPVSYGAVLSAEELMRRRYMVQKAADEHNEDGEAGPSFGPGPAPGPSMGPSYGGDDVSAEELMRRRYEVPSYVAEDVESDEDEDQGPAPGPARGPPAGAQFSYPAQQEVDSEELMRQRYEIPDAVEAEDVHSDDGRDNEYFSEDDVRSAGEPEPTFDDENNGVADDLEDPDEEPLELNLRNLYPARLPASFTALPQTRSYALPAPALPSVAPKPISNAYSSAINFNDYGDDEDEEDEDEVVEEPTSKIQPYASAAPQAPAVLPARAPENIPISSYYPEGMESAEITHAVVKGPKIVKTDRALTAFVPNAIKKKRLHSGMTPATTFSTFRKPVAVTADPVEVEAEADAEADADMDAFDEFGNAIEEPASKAARHDRAATDFTASLHAATSALFRPSAAPAIVLTSAAVAAGRAPVAPIAFVPATTSTVSVSKATVAPVTSAEDDAMALFFSEINQLEGV